MADWKCHVNEDGSMIIDGRLTFGHDEDDPEKKQYDMLHDAESGQYLYLLAGNPDVQRGFDKEQNAYVRVLAYPTADKRFLKVQFVQVLLPAQPTASA